jgi:hypothetical protein
MCVGALENEGDVMSCWPPQLFICVRAQLCGWGWFGYEADHEVQSED